jgi:hypothetical protein
MINRTHALPVMRQCQLLALSRSTAYYQPTPVSAADLALMRRIDELHLNHPFAGARMLRDLLRRAGHSIGRRHVSTLMTCIGIEAVYRKPHTSQRHPAHPVYPYLLRNVEITRSNHVWAADITYLPIPPGFVYLCAVMDWASRRVLAWRLANTGDNRFLYGGGPRGRDQLWRTDYLQHRSRMPIHEPGVHGDPESARHSDQHGRHRLLARQRVRGATLEEHQIRERSLCPPTRPSVQPTRDWAAT